MTEQREEGLYLADIRDAIDRVLAYTVKGREAFLTDPMMQDAVVRQGGESPHARRPHRRHPYPVPTPLFRGAVHAGNRVQIHVRSQESLRAHPLLPDAR